MIRRPPHNRPAPQLSALQQTPPGAIRLFLFACCCAALGVLAMPTLGEASEPAEGLALYELVTGHENIQFEGWESDGRLSFRGPDGETFRRQPSEIVRYGRGVHDRRGQGLLLVDGSWLAGRVTEIRENECRVRGRYFNASIPRPLVRAVLLSAPSIDGLQEEMIRESLVAEGSNDIAIGVDGDRTSGALQTIPQEAEESDVVWQRGVDELSLLAGNRPLRIPAARVRAIVFSPLLTPRIPADPESVVVGLADGSRLQVRRWSGAEAGTTVELSSGAELTLPPRAEAANAVVYLSPSKIGGAGQASDVRRLSDEPPLRMRVKPLFGAAYDAPPQAVDRVWGNLPTVGGHWYGNAIAMPSASQAVFRGMPMGSFFRAQVAIRDPEHPDAASGSARFRVLVVGREGLLREVWKSEPIRGDEGLADVFVRIPPTAAVVLAVEQANRGGAGDRAVWIDPVLTSL